MFAYPQKTKDRAYSLRKSNYTYSEIAQKIKVSPQTIYHWIKEYKTINAASKGKKVYSFGTKQTTSKTKTTRKTPTKTKKR